jgi:oxygen-independent coproporphyrinogen III oxidase
MIALDQDTLKKFDVAGPRYTSYPTADRFHEAFGAEDYWRALGGRRFGVLANPVSVYVHLPFCESLCYYCACNKIITRHHNKAAGYLELLRTELSLIHAAIGSRIKTTQIHLGGGSPTFLSDAELAQLWALLKQSFEPVAGGEFTIEVDPRTVDTARLNNLYQIGFNRLSFGVQDFDEDVQKAVHREQSTEHVFRLVEQARSAGFESINVDLIYGLPRQSVTGFKSTLAKVLALAPDRIAMYGYAHLPQRFKAQRRIVQADLPSASDRLAMLGSAIQTLEQGGYEYIAMDHFALPHDSLAVAKRNGSLHRNFQGYSTQADTDLIGLGVSAISKVGAVYSQNAKTLDDYQDLLTQGSLPVVRGFFMQRDDLARRAIIMALMCQGEVEFDALEAAYLINFQAMFAREIQALRRFEDAGWIRIDSRRICLTPQGWYFVRLIAMVFDRYLNSEQDQNRYSQVL